MKKTKSSKNNVKTFKQSYYNFYDDVKDWSKGHHEDWWIKNQINA